MRGDRERLRIVRFGIAAGFDSGVSPGSAGGRGGMASLENRGSNSSRIARA